MKVDLNTLVKGAIIIEYCLASNKGIEAADLDKLQPLWLLRPYFPITLLSKFYETNLGLEIIHYNHQVFSSVTEVSAGA